MADTFPWAFAGVSAAVRLATGIGGVLTGLYARGRAGGLADGARDQRIDDHERRLATQGAAIQRLDADANNTGRAVAGLAAEVKAVARTTDVMAADVREIRGMLAASQGKGR